MKRMNRRTLLLLPMLGAGCARQENPLKDMLPVQVQREYVLKETHRNPVEQAPELARKLGLRRWETAVYRAKEEIDVQVFQMNAEANAFEMMQKWNKAEGAVFFKGPYVLVATSPTLPRQVVLEFVQDLRANLKL